MTQNKKIAITGGIGCGKSSVSKFISDAGYKVYSCDEIYTQLLDGELTEKIAKIFEGVVDKNGKLNRKKLSEIVFNDKEKLKILTNLTNTEVINLALNEMKKEDGICFCEVPLLFENGYENLFDGVIIVTRDLSERIKSVALRDKLTEEEVISRINSQYNYNKCDFTKYYVIHNCSDLANLKLETQYTIDKIKKGTTK